MQKDIPIEMVEPWGEVNDSKALNRELAAELRKDGLLYGQKVNAVAMRCDCDDVLYEFLDGSGRYAVVHLTWSGKTDPNVGWPETQVYESLNDWIHKCMKPDHDEYNL
jgi:hypothetical protein